jgi:hypothetical protein
MVKSSDKFANASTFACNILKQNVALYGIILQYILVYLYFRDKAENTSRNCSLSKAKRIFFPNFCVC